MWTWKTGLTMMPPFVAIAMALTTKRVVPSLLSGLFVAAVVARQGAWIPQGIGAEAGCLLGGDGCADSGLLTAFTSYIADAVFDLDNLTIMAFTLFVAAMIGVMGASGATTTLVSAVERLAKGPRGTMVASWLAGFVVFFDDYANCLVVGQSMGPVCDRNGVSRAKLAYIVDSTAAPVASLTLVSTWVGYEVGLIDDALATVGRGGDGFALFVEGLPYRFYVIFALALVGIVAWSGRDIGPMLASESEARRAHTPRVPAPAPGARSLVVAALPVITLVVVSFGLMLESGFGALELPFEEAPLYAILDGADPFFSMFVGAGAGFGLATGLAVGSGALTTEGAVSATASGMRNVAEALVVLYLAWSLGNGIADTEAQAFLTSALSGRLPAVWLPVLTFAVASATAFATGTSFGTMSILVPLVVPLAATMADTTPVILAASSSAVLAGACMGDHASPISDTTVLSAAGAGVDLVTHVRTQLPYALLATTVAIVCGYLPVAFGVSVWLTLPLGLVALVVAMRVLGREPELT